MPRRDPPSKGRFIEIVNWKKAQHEMPAKGAIWMKLYTSLLKCHQFRELSDASRMLVIALWLYAAESGRHVFPADPQWLWDYIPMLNEEPDLRPLLEAVDEYGEPAPFIRIVDKAGIYNIRNRQSKKKRESKTKNETEPLRAPEKKREKKRARAQDTREQQQNSPDQTRRDQTSTEAGPEQGQQPVNPAKPEAEGQRAAQRPTTAPTASPGPRPAFHSEPQPIRTIIENFEHWLDPDAKAFGYEIFEALGLNKVGDPESQWGKSERGTFTKWLHRQPDRAKARTHGLHVAKNIGKYAKTVRSPGAVWLDAVNGKTRAPPASNTG